MYTDKLESTVYSGKAGKRLTKLKIEKSLPERWQEGRSGSGLYLIKEMLSKQPYNFGTHSF
jgi:hypothetical protein